MCTRGRTSPHGQPNNLVICLRHSECALLVRFLLLPSLRFPDRSSSRFTGTNDGSHLNATIVSRARDCHLSDFELTAVKVASASLLCFCGKDGHLRYQHRSAARLHVAWRQLQVSSQSFPPKLFVKNVHLGQSSQSTPTEPWARGSDNVLHEIDTIVQLRAIHYTHQSTTRSSLLDTQPASSILGEDSRKPDARRGSAEFDIPR